MKYKIFFFLLISSCVNNTYTQKSNFLYSAKGFALIERQITEYANTSFLVSHNKLKLGTKVRISNPSNKKFIETVVKKKIKYNNFYKVSISENIAKQLSLNTSFPYVEITEIRLNKSFIAKKAITENIEKKIANKAPVTKINIDNLTNPKKTKKNKKDTYSILVAEFYNFRSAEILKERLKTILVNSNYQLIHINKKSNKSYQLLMGPYNTINKLKNDYISLSDSNFEDLDIKIND
ncbi:hypothetical protein OAM15_03190 [Pelagibacteraceae bacterium]|nr:hypothetical protein [Pelagibacteraceae bacterium]|tara:strand:- start:954 stop:1661 length:708 start_codon:yes stop_codon:yes gene_type:complete